MQTQCWICPECKDDKHHEPGDKYCRAQKNNSELFAKIEKLSEALEQTMCAMRLAGWEDDDIYKNAQKALLSKALQDGLPLRSNAAQKQIQVIDHAKTILKHAPQPPDEPPQGGRK